VRRVSLLLAAADAARAAQATAAMVQLELPHINVLTKVDLLNEPSKARHLSGRPCGTRRPALPLRPTS